MQYIFNLWNFHSKLSLIIIFYRNITNHGNKAPRKYFSDLGQRKSEYENLNWNLKQILLGMKTSHYAGCCYWSITWNEATKKEDRQACVSSVTHTKIFQNHIRTFEFPYHTVAFLQNTNKGMPYFAMGELWVDFCDFIVWIVSYICHYQI